MRVAVIKFITWANSMWEGGLASTTTIKNMQLLENEERCVRIFNSKTPK